MGDGAGFGERKTVQSVSNVRLLFILEVSQKRYGISFHRQYVFINVVGFFLNSWGGWVSVSQKERRSDLGVTVALGISMMLAGLFWGEVGGVGGGVMVSEGDGGDNDFGQGVMFVGLCICYTPPFQTLDLAYN